MVPTYRPNDLLLDALASIQRALDRASVSFQLEVVDDASPDLDVAALIDGWVDQGRLNPIPVHRRLRNGGLGECWNTCIRRAQGEFVHLLHQDDLVDDDFYATLLALADRCPDAGMLFCRTRFLQGGQERLDALEQDRAGLIDGWLERISAGQRLQCPSVIVRREVYARLGGFEAQLRYIIDWEMWVRIAANVRVVYEPRALAVYRIHDAAETGRIKSSGVASRDAANGLRAIKKALRRAGRLDCYPAAVRFAMSISGFAAVDAERNGNTGVLLEELKGSVLYLGREMPITSLVAQLKWYARVWFKFFGKRLHLGS